MADVVVIGWRSAVTQVSSELNAFFCSQDHEVFGNYPDRNFGFLQRIIRNPPRIVLLEDDVSQSFWKKVLTSEIERSLREAQINFVRFTSDPRSIEACTYKVRQALTPA